MRFKRGSVEHRHRAKPKHTVIDVDCYICGLKSILILSLDLLLLRWPPCGAKARQGARKTTGAHHHKHTAPKPHHNTATTNTSRGSCGLKFNPGTTRRVVEATLVAHLASNAHQSARKAKIRRCVSLLHLQARKGKKHTRAGLGSQII